MQDARRRRELTSGLLLHAPKEHSPDFSGECPLHGGGGGTAVPSLSRRAGLCLHPSPHSRRVGCGACYPNRSIPIRILGPAPMPLHLSQSMSLYTAGRVGLVPPLGVAMPLAWRRVHRMSPVIHFTLTSEGNRLRQLNPRPQALDVRLYVRSCFFVFSPSATRRAGKTSGQRR